MKATVKSLAEEADLEVDEALVRLWDAGFQYLTGPRDALAKRDANRARRCLGLATRREIGEPKYWLDLLKWGSAELDSWLANMGMRASGEKLVLNKKAINRLRAEARAKGLWPPKESKDLSLAVPSVVMPRKKLEWQIVGKNRDLSYLDADDVLMIHRSLVEDFAKAEDPIDPSGVRSQGLLESAIGRPRTSIGSDLKYPTVEMSAAALLHAIVHNHPFHNGNKRTGLVAMLVHLDENGCTLTCDEDELFRLVLLLAQHAIFKGDRADTPDGEVLEVARWLCSRTRWIERGERPLQWRRLRRILLGYGCLFDYPTGVGNRINISRVVTEKGPWYGSPRRVMLQVQASYAGEGQEVAKNAISMIRKSLRLDDEAGIDSRKFYDDEDGATGEFIVRYRKTLRRLAKL